MYKSVISLLVYTKPEVIIDQILNFHHFNPKSAIVLHFNPVFEWQSDLVDSIEQFARILDRLEYVYVNPQRVRCGWADIIEAHMSNFRFAYDNIDFEYFTFAASNELYCKCGRENLLVGQAALCNHRKIDVDRSEWRQLNGMKEDKYFNDIFPEEVGAKYIYCGFCEGTSYRRDVFKKMVDLIESVYIHDEVNHFYAREEIYFPLAYRKVSMEEFTYRRTTYMPWRKGLITTCIDVCDILDNIKDYYSLKRVDLDIYAPVRTFIRQNVGRYQEELVELIGKQIEEYSITEITEADDINVKKQEAYLKGMLEKEKEGLVIWCYV